jgi:hypothetical protein
MDLVCSTYAVRRFSTLSATPADDLDSDLSFSAAREKKGGTEVPPLMRSKALIG